MTRLTELFQGLLAPRRLAATRPNQDQCRDLERLMNGTLKPITKDTAFCAQLDAIRRSLSHS